MKCVTPASGGKYYPDHLQVLGIVCVCVCMCVCTHACMLCVLNCMDNNFMQSLLPIYPGAPHCPPKQSEFVSSDYVCVEVDAEVFAMLQQTHGGWNPAMANVGWVSPFWV